jgi:SNF2 family DNA or RNA helicase
MNGLNQDSFFIVREMWWVHPSSYSLYDTSETLSLSKDGVRIDGQLVRFDRSRTNLVQKSFQDLDDTLWTVLVSYPSPPSSVYRRSICIDAYINLKSLSRAVKFGVRFSGRDIFYVNVMSRLQEVSQDNFLLTKTISYSMKAFVLKAYQEAFQHREHTETKQESRVDHGRLKSRLYDFQKQSVARMVRLENEGTKLEELTNQYTLVSTPGHRIWVSRNDTIFNDNDKNYKPDTRTVEFKGGFLTDEMGMGKTITILDLCATCPIKESATAMRPKSTLIVCPSHIISHWKAEISKHTNMTSVVITVKDQIESLTVKEIMANKYDFVLVSFNMFCNPLFRRQMDYYNCENRKKGAAFFHDFQRQSSKMRQSQNFVPHIFSWGRMIIDEFHELGNACYPGVCNFVSSINCERLWLVSGTPLVNPAVLQTFVPMVFFSESVGVVRTHDTMIQVIKASNVKNEKYDHVEIPSFQEKVYKIELNKSERLIYDGIRSEGRDEQLKVCSYARLARCLIGEVEVENIDEMEVMVKEFLVNKMKGLEEKIELHNSKIEVMRPLVPDLEERTRESFLLKQMLTSHERLETHLRDTKRTIEYVRKTEQTECVICMEVMESPCVIKNCGHKICDTCLPRVMQINSKCPLCRIDYTKADIIRISKGHDNEMLRKYGSKLYHLFKLLEDTPQIKTLIFSQWDELLRDVGKCITSFNTSKRVLFCRGNIMQKKSTIDKFLGNDKYNLLLLSTLNSASGCDFSIAKRVILLDTIDGTGSFITGIERQAIARCHRIGQTSSIEVVRLIAKDTIEEEIYDKIKGEQQS